jgi:HSP20 family protein
MMRMSRQLDALNDLLQRRTPEHRNYSAGVFPLVNMTETADNYYLRAELPGIDSDELDIQLVGRNLMISGERKIPIEGGNARYHRREREAGKFSRIIGLPDDIDSEKLEAKLENGILTITIAKSEAAKPRKISVK